jgi:uncharacterized coiled-coil protein SlyX
MRTGVLILALAILGCAPNKATDRAPTPASRSSSARAARESERRIAKLELELLEKEAQVDELQSRLNEAREEVVRAMAKLQTLASRADAASGMAEAELALQPLSAQAGQASAPEAAQAAELLKESSMEFEKENYAGAVYLANQAKTLAAAGRARLASDGRVVERAGETPFALPIPLKSTRVGNVREGPGTDSPVVFSVQPDEELTGYSYINEWIRIGDDRGRGGWIFRDLIVRR